MNFHEQTQTGGNTAVLEVPEEVLDTFRFAAAGRVTVTCASVAEAEALRFRLHHIRRQMRRFSHPLVDVAERVTFKLNGKQLIAQPSSDAKLRNVLGKALKKEKRNGSRTTKKP